MSERKEGLQRRSLLQKVLGVSAAGLTGMFGREALAQQAQAPVTAAMVTNIAITVADLDKSVKFYSDVFGFKPAPKPVKIGAALSGLLEAKDLDLTIQFMDTGSGTARIELLSFTNPKPVGEGGNKASYTRGLVHLQIRVPDVKAAIEKTKAAGGTVLENTRLAQGDILRAIFVLDPDGTRIELVP